MMDRYLAVVFFFLTLWGSGLILAHEAQACDSGNYYDPSHAICQPSPPAYTPPGFGWPPQNGGANYGPAYPGTYPQR